ncbi:hypothetical protein TrVE_jg5282 [Triparma verrucosa]|uniref:HP domain-containing protein n=1 Tax=Triparma verrucosa TaxID=1606542 RepID=A0A9W7FNY7_9STRA|nr:hypothetical protein TrVE_jg5282 [Triparma verrucosa]
MKVPDSLQKFDDDNGGVFGNCSKLVPSDIDVSDSNAVVTYLRAQPLAQACIKGDIPALKAILGDNVAALFKLQYCRETPFLLTFDKPLCVKFIIQTFPAARIGSKSPLEYAKEMKAPQLTIDMLEFLTADEMKVCGDTEAEIKAAIEEKKATLSNNKSAMANIVDFTAREKATELQTKMFGELKAAAVNDAQVTFDELKAFCGDQAKRLGDLIAVVMNKYKTTDPRRYEPFEQVKDIAVKEQVPPPATLPLPEQVEFQLANATWYEEGFQAAMKEVAAVFNEAKTCEEICEHYDIDNSGGKWSKELRAEVFNLDLRTNQVVRAKFGPPKGFPRALEKMSQGKTLRDLNRVTFEFEDPLLMALCFEVLNKKYNIHGLKNKYLQETFKEPPNLHMNLDIKDGWLCEVQMLFRDILLIKKELHKFYDVNRADGPFVVAGKLFKSLEDPGEQQRDEDSKYRSGLQSGGEDSLLMFMKAKDSELKTKDELLKAKDEQLNGKDAEVQEITALKDAEIERLKSLLSQSTSHEDNAASPPPPPPQMAQEGTYTYSHLLFGGTIEGVDPKKKESYLSPSEFSHVFAMSPSDFSSLPAWKQMALKKEKKLF